MKQNHNAKKRNETAKTNNGLKSLILRYKGVQGWYIGAVNKYLLMNHQITFLKGDISRIVNDKVQLTPRWLLIKEAVEHVVTEWGRSIGALSAEESLISTPAGVLVITAKKETLEVA